LATNAYSLYPLPKLFERRAIGDRPLDSRAIKLVNEILRTKLSVVLESVVDELEAPKTTVSGTADARCSVGVYVMAEPVDTKPAFTKQSFLREIDLASSDARASLGDDTGLK